MARLGRCCEPAAVNCCVWRRPAGSGAATAAAGVMAKRAHAAAAAAAAAVGVAARESVIQMRNQCCGTRMKQLASLRLADPRHAVITHRPPMHAVLVVKLLPPARHHSHQQQLLRLRLPPAPPSRPPTPAATVSCCYCFCWWPPPLPPPVSSSARVASSPALCISMRMSEPPMNSPLTNTCERRVVRVRRVC